MTHAVISKQIRNIIAAALAEDIGTGDITTMAIVSHDKTGLAQAIAKDDFVIAGSDIFKEAFLLLDDKIKVRKLIFDGERAKKGSIIAEISGSLFYILQAERVALNLFQRMCGTATLTAKFVKAAHGTKAKILDTRKTLPGLRVLDKMAVSIGGGFNHRMGLYDGVLIKDNHIAAAGSITAAVEMQRRSLSHTLKIEVETKNIAEVKEALKCGVDIIMLDNMTSDEMKKAAAFVAGRALIEASGNVSLHNVAEIAATGVDLISVGELTHSVRAADISLKIIVETPIPKAQRSGIGKLNNPAKRRV
jgi:nicotinate-nucleotide pyrophosphorylase (carboxylating)